MNTFEQISKETESIKNLIEAGHDDFDIHTAIQLKQLVDRIQSKRKISTQAARKIARELLEGG